MIKHITPQETENIQIRVLPDGRLSRRDAANYLGLAPNTLAMWKVQGKGPRSVVVGSRCFYYKAELDSFIQGGSNDNL